MTINPDNAKINQGQNNNKNNINLIEFDSGDFSNNNPDNVNLLEDNKNNIVNKNNKNINDIFSNIPKNNNIQSNLSDFNYINNF